MTCRLACASPERLFPEEEEKDGIDKYLDTQLIKVRGYFRPMLADTHLVVLADLIKAEDGNGAGMDSTDYCREKRT